MSALISILLVIGMLFSSIGGYLTGMEGPVTIQVKAGADADAFSAYRYAQDPDQEDDTGRIIADVLNAVQLSMTVGKDASEIRLATAEDPVLSVGVKTGEEGTRIVTDLLKGLAIQVSQEEMARMTESAVSTNPESTMDLSSLTAGIDQEQATKDINEVFDGLMQALEAKKGEAQPGAAELDGLTFAAKVPVEMTYAELMTAVLNSMKDLVSRETFKPYAGAFFGEEDPAQQIEKMIENLQKEGAGDRFETDLAVYLTAEEEAYYAFDLIQKAEEDGADPVANAHVGYGLIGGVSHFTMTMLQNGAANADIAAKFSDKGTFDVNAVVISDSQVVTIAASKNEEGRSEAKVEILEENNQTAIHAVWTVGEDKSLELAAELFLTDMEKPMFTLELSAANGGEVASVFDGEGIKTVIPVSELYGENGEAVMKTIQSALTVGAMKALPKLYKQLPDGTKTWIAAKIAEAIKNSMKPAATAIPEANPAEAEPAEEAPAAEPAEPAEAAPEAEPAGNE